MEPDSKRAERDALIAELSDLAIRILSAGGPGALAACAVSLTEGAAAGVPAEALPIFAGQLLEAVVSGARIAAGHSVTITDLGQVETPSGGVH